MKEKREEFDDNNEKRLLDILKWLCLQRPSFIGLTLSPTPVGELTPFFTSDQEQDQGAGKAVGSGPRRS